MTIKANDGTLVPLHPKTTQNQIIDWDVGTVHGPYTLTLSASGWSNNQQTLALNGVSSTDIVECAKVLTGTKEQMLVQQGNYNLLTTLESLQNQIRFTCSSTPTSDITVQVHWTR